MQENFQRKTILREVFAALSIMQAVENISSNYYYLGSEISEERNSKCSTTFMNETQPPKHILYLNGTYIHISHD